MQSDWLLLLRTTFPEVAGVQLQWELQVELWLVEPRQRGREELTLGTTRGTCGPARGQDTETWQEPVIPDLPMLRLLRG